MCISPFTLNEEAGRQFDISLWEEEAERDTTRGLADEEGGSPSRLYVKPGLSYANLPHPCGRKHVRLLNHKVFRVKISSELSASGIAVVLVSSCDLQYVRLIRFCKN